LQRMSAELWPSASCRICRNVPDGRLQAVEFVEMFPTAVCKPSNLSKCSRQSSASRRICRNVPDGRPQAVEFVEMFPTVVCKPSNLSKCSRRPSASRRICRILFISLSFSRYHCFQRFKLGRCCFNCSIASSFVTFTSAS
jgi:hypothetical protein